MLKLESTSKTPGELVKTQIPGPHPQILHSVRVEWDHGSAFLTGFQPRLTDAPGHTWRGVILDEPFTKFRSL